jgi:hypothetical protein
MPTIVNGRRSHVPELNRFADRLFVRPPRLRQRRTDHRDMRRVGHVAIVEQPAAHERDAHHLEIPAARDSKFRASRPRRIAEQLPKVLHAQRLVRPRHDDERAVPGLAAGQRHGVHRAGLAHARQRAHPSEQVRVRPNELAR